MKVSTVLSDVTGETGRKILEQAIEGKAITKEWVTTLYSGRGKGRLKASIEEIIMSV